METVKLLPVVRKSVSSDVNSSFESVSSSEDIDVVNTTVADDRNATVADTTPDSSTEKKQPEEKAHIQKKKPIEPVNWTPVGCYKCKDDVEKYIKSHDCFYEQSRNETKNGVTVYHYCDKVITKDSSRCPAKLKVFQNKNSISFGVSVSTFVHDHTGLQLKKVEFSETIKKEVFTMKMQFNLTPKLIAKHLERQFPNDKLPSIPQVRTILREMKRVEIPSTVTYGQLVEWCILLSEPPTDEDQSFVLDHFYNDTDNSFAFVVSTLRLLRNAANRKNVCADGTYKIVW